MVRQPGTEREKGLGLGWMPREHGAIAELAFPLLSGLIIGGFTPAGAGFAAAAVFLFLAYEPAAILLGIRGARLREQWRGVARRRVVLLGVAGGAAGILGFALAPPAARLLALVPAVLAATLVPAAAARRVKTLAGEVVVAAALAGMHLPIARAGGAVGVAVGGPAALWAAVSILAILGVHSLKARFKHQPHWSIPATVVAAGAAVAAVVLLVAAGPPLRRLGLALAAPALAGLTLSLLPLHPRHLKRVGWTLVAADALALVALVA